MPTYSKLAEIEATRSLRNNVDMARLSRSLAGALFLALAAAPALAQDKVKIAIIAAASDIGFYAADAKGWFKEVGVEVEFIRMDSGARMIGPMASGDIDVGTGAISAGFYNATGRDIKLRIVADKGRNVKGMSFQGFVVRKDLVDSGAVKSLADIAGRTVALTAPGGVDSSTLGRAMRSVGKEFEDAKIQFLGFPAQMAAYENKAIDASIMPEHFRSLAINRGLVVELLPIAAFRDNQMVGIVTFSEKFSIERADVARRMMKAYVRGVRFYVDAIRDNKLAGPNAGEIIDIIARYSNLKDKAIIANMIPTAMEPVGHVNFETLKEDLDFFREKGMVKIDVDLNKIVDRSFIDWAIRELGPYRR